MLGLSSVASGDVGSSRGPDEEDVDWFEEAPEDEFELEAGD